MKIVSNVTFFILHLLWLIFDKVDTIIKDSFEEDVKEKVMMN
jgi:hypothetical protein